MRWPDKLSLRRKITLVIMVNTFAALCVASIAFAEYGVYRFKNLQMQDLNALANVMGTNSTAALAFKDQNSARDVLQALAAKPHILAAVIYDRNGKPFAVYHKGTSKEIYSPPPVNNETSRFTSDRVLIFQVITLDGERVGNIFLEGDTVEYKQLLEGYLLFFALIILAVSLGAYATAEWLQRPISNPILELAWTTKLVTGSRDYSVRARKRSEDEVGVLIDGFNEMLAQIQIRDGELNSAREDLEQRVNERTMELEQEIGDRQRAQEALHESEERIRLLLDSTAEAIYGVDRDGNCTFSNPATLRLLGYQKPEDLLGKSMHQVMHHSYLDGTPYPRKDCIIGSSLAKGEGIHSDLEVFWRADGTSFPVEYWAYPTRKEGEVIGSVVTFLDITERKQAQSALLEAKEAAEAGSRAKSEFLANMSHEIRTPMNGVIGMTDLALDTELTGEQREYLSLVKSSADGLLRLINDILDFSKIEAGKLELEETEFEIRDLFSNTLKTLAVRADKKHLELSARVSGAVPGTVVGDPTRLRQLIVNLVGNAIKFTEQGNVVVDAELEGEPGEAVHLHIRVSDTGIGIPPEKQQLIFESFAQADGSMTRRFGGTGLGLTISRRIVELMGGRMWVESEVGRGSAFHFTTTFRHAPSIQRGSSEPEGKALQGLPVLVVDDNSTNRNILGEMLANWRMSPVLAENGASALNAMEAAQRAGDAFRVVLLDTRMPGMDGFDLAERIQKNPALAGSVILMLSSDHRLADMGRCRDLGVGVFLTKPIGQSELLDAILIALGMHAVESQLTETLPTAKERPKGRKLRILLAEDNAVNQKLAIRLLEKAGHNVFLAKNGKEVLEVLDQSQPPDFDVVLMDIQMPEMDGMQATAGIREREKSSGSHLPIIAMTANAMRGDRERYLSGGMDGYISKPINPTGLFAEIERCLAGIGKSATMTENSSMQAEQLDRTSLLERVEGDQELLSEMIQLFLADAPQLLGAMRKALRQGDMVLLERSAHSMKGAAGNLSALVTVSAALQLEQSAKKRRFGIIESKSCGPRRSRRTVTSRARRSLPGGSEMKILIADDEPVSRRMLQGLLTKWGYEVVSVEDGNAAWEQLNAPDAPRIALLDWMMPGKDGVDVCREVRAHRPEPYTYIILLTAKDAKESVVEGLESGADDYLTKPFHPQELKARLRVGIRLLELEDTLVQARETMRFKATHDALTEVWNRGTILEKLDREVTRSRREGPSLGVLIADLDHFKSINDTYGHLVGDSVLREVTKRMLANVRPYDAVGRYGGEEFLILLPGCDAAATAKKGEQLRVAIAQQPIDTQSGPLRITMSLGGVATADWLGDTANQILQMADAALYRAKEEGRNRTEMAGAAEHEEAHRPSLELSSQSTEKE